MTTDIAFNESFVPFFLIKSKERSFSWHFRKSLFWFFCHINSGQIITRNAKKWHFHTLFCTLVPESQGTHFKLFQAAKQLETWKNCDRKSAVIRFFKCIKIVSSLHWWTISKLVSLLHIQSIHGKMWIQDVWTSGIDWNLPGKLTLEVPLS